MSDDQEPTTPPPPAEESDAERLERAIHDQPTVAPARWVVKIVAVIVLVGVALLVWWVGRSLLPREWAQHVKGQANGSLTAGTSWGLFYGFVFTFVPLVLLFQIRRRFFSWAWRGIVAVAAVVLAIPNWLTLYIVVSGSKAAHDGERIFSDNAPGFRWGSLWGAVVGAVLAVLITGASMRLARRKKQVAQLKGERDELRARQREAEEARRED